MSKEEKFDSKIEYNGKIYMGNGEAYDTCRTFKDCFYDVEEGEEYIDEWAETAIDEDGKMVTITYQFECIKGEAHDPDQYDWISGIVDVKPLD